MSQPPLKGLGDYAIVFSLLLPLTIPSDHSSPSLPIGSSAVNHAEAHEAMHARRMGRRRGAGDGGPADEYKKGASHSFCPRPPGKPVPRDGQGDVAW